MTPDEIKFRLLGLEEAQDAVAEKPTYPSGWTPGVVWEGTKGTITTNTLTDPPTDWSDILRERGLDPEIYEVAGDTIRWTSYDGWKRDNPGEQAYSAICYSYKAEIRLKRPIVDSTDEDLLKLYAEAKKDKKSPRRSDEVDCSLVINLSDWQIGNGDGGGAATQMAALAALPSLLVGHLKGLRKQGIPVERALIAGLGDLLEGTCGFYPSQAFQVELDRREQARVVRRALTDIVRTVSREVTELTVLAVGGNHGENRSNGKRHTGYGDNDDVAVFEQVADIISEGTYDNVGFRLPADRLALSIDLHGQIVAFTHGHLPNPGKNAAETMWGWWQQQAMGRHYEGVADANILVTGHYHHLNLKEQEGRTVMVCPSLTRVGDWFANARGVRSKPGTLTFTVDANGWNNLTVLR